MKQYPKVIVCIKIISIMICWGLMYLLGMNFGAYRGIKVDQKIISSQLEYKKSTKGWVTSASINILSEKDFYNMKCRSYTVINAMDLNFKEYFFDSNEERKRLKDIFNSQYRHGNTISVVQNWFLLGKSRLSEPSVNRVIFSTMLFLFLILITYFLFNKSWKLVLINLFSIPFCSIFLSCI